ncbi:hypothetical protein [Nonomuraea sp. NPDC050310]|uniref:hypothetical protein n=1 Tax=unclassified Nonomuraea TaxID=2593643 RepID=UPI0033E2806D
MNARRALTALALAAASVFTFATVHAAVSEPATSKITVVAGCNAPLGVQCPDDDEWT